MHGKESSGLIQKHWPPTEFEELANSIDKDDNAISGDNNYKLQNTENWEDRRCCQLILMGKLELFLPCLR